MGMGTDGLYQFRVCSLKTTDLSRLHRLRRGTGAEEAKRKTTLRSTAVHGPVLCLPHACLPCSSGSSAPFPRLPSPQPHCLSFGLEACYGCTVHICEMNVDQ